MKVLLATEKMKSKGVSNCIPWTRNGVTNKIFKKLFSYRIAICSIMLCIFIAKI